MGMVKPIIQRIDIWFVQLDPTRGSEIKKNKTLYCHFTKWDVSIENSDNSTNDFKGIFYPSRIPCTFQGKKGLVLLDQMRAVDKIRLIQKLGVISRNAQMKIVNCLQELFAY